jgi:hypothetical protein
MRNRCRRITQKGAVSFLEKIMSGELHIFNPCQINISELGEIITTSMVLRDYSLRNSGIYIRYFNFKKNNVNGSILEINKEYFVEYEGDKE